MGGRSNSAGRLLRAIESILHGLLASAKQQRSTGFIDSLERRQLLAGNLKVLESTFRFDAMPLPQALVFEFDDAVNATLGTADLAVTNLLTNATVTTTVAYPTANNIAVFSFPAASGAGKDYLPTGEYRAILTASGFSGATTSTQLSANHTFEFEIASGDANMDGTGDFDDLLIVAQNYGATSGKTWSQGDFTYDGAVNFDDLLLQAQSYGVTSLLDLSIDSDNTSSSAPQNAASEHSIEEEPTHPGKIITVNNGDDDGDGVPDFAELTAARSFVPIDIGFLPTGVDPLTARIRLIYDDSDPSGSTNPPASGSLRLWTKDGDEGRNAASILSGGDFVPDSDSLGTAYYTAAQLGISTTVGRTLYVEAVRPSVRLADLSIRIELDADGTPSTAPLHLDTVKLTAVNATPAYFKDPNADRPGGTAVGADGGDSMSMSYSGGVRYSDGSYRITSSDLDPSETGMLSGHTRTWRSEAAGSFGVDAPNGNGWNVSQWPSLVQTTNSLVAVSGGRVVQWFDQISPDAYEPRDFSLDKIKLVTITSLGLRYQLIDTLGNTFLYHPFTNSIPANKRGQLDRYIDAGGNETVFTYISSANPMENGRIDKVNRFRRSDGVSLEQLDYSYDTTSGRLTKVEMQRRNDFLTTPALAVVRTVEYEYYGLADPNGNPGDLKRVKVYQPDITSGPVVEQKLYRYDSFGRPLLVLEGASYERAVGTGGFADPGATSVSNSQLAPYADLVLEWYAVNDANVLRRNKVAAQVVQGEGRYEYDYLVDNDRGGVRTYETKTVERLPKPASSDTGFDRNFVYSNAAGQVLLNVFRTKSQNDPAPTGNNVDGWKTAFDYDIFSGRLMSVANPSAVATFTETQNYPANLNTTGLVNTYGYISTGTAFGYLQNAGRKRGSGGTINQTKVYSYVERPSVTAGASNAHVLLTEGGYRDAGNTNLITTSYTNTFASGTNSTGNALDLLQTRVTTLPNVSTAQNGDGAANVTTITDLFDVFARITSVTDGDGKVTELTYVDSTGAVRQEIIDKGTGLLNLTTAYVSDLLGRNTQITTPKGVLTSGNPNDYVSTIQYFDAAAVKRIVTTPPVASGEDEPLRITRFDRANGVMDEIQVDRENATTVNVVARTQMAYDAQQRLLATDRYFSTEGLSYNLSTGVITGSDGFYRTEVGYDGRGRQDRVAVGRNPFVSMALAAPTVTRTVFDGLDRPQRTWVGTDYSSWSTWIETSPGGFTKTQELEYDGGSGAVGDSNTTRVILPVDAVSANDRVTQNFYDWRNRLVASKSGVQGSEAAGIDRPIDFNKYDNLDRSVASYVFDGDTLSIGDTVNNDTFVAVADGVPDLPASGQMRSAMLTQYDDRGRIFRETTFSVNQTSGVSGGIYNNTAAQFAALTESDIISLGGLRTNHWYNDRDHVIKTRAPNGLVTKFAYDGAGRETAQYATDGGDTRSGNSGGLDGNFAQAGDVIGDAVLEQTETAYDANSNVLLVTTRHRHHNETATGSLQDGANAPKARVTFVGNWYDESDRLTTTVDFGNNGSDALTYPSTPPARVTSNAWDDFLRTDISYAFDANDDFSSYTTITSPRGIKTETRLDGLGRTTQVWEAREGTPGLGAPTPGIDTNRGTLYSYNGFDALVGQTSRTYTDGGARNYSIQLNYGVTKGGNHSLNHSGLLNNIIYSTSTGGSPLIQDREDFTGYNAQGQNTHKTTRNTTTHVFAYNVLGQFVSDTWTPPSGGAPQKNKISEWATKLEFGFDALGRGDVFTVWNGASKRNEVIRTFDGLGNLVTEATTINDGSYFSGPAVTVTGSVGYDHTPNFSANRDRLQKITYPDGRIRWSDYGTSGSLNDRISRVEFLSDASAVGAKLETYTYLGLSRVVKRDYVSFVNDGTGSFGGSQLNDDTWILDGDNDPTFGSIDDAGTNDPYNGLDRFGRVVEMGWNKGGSSIGVTRQYAYDADGNVLYAFNPKGGSNESWRSDNFQFDGDSAQDAYDKLGRLRHWERGRLTDSTGRLDTANIGFPIEPQQKYGVDNWDIDANGNFDRLTAPARLALQGQVPLSPMDPPDDELERQDVFFKFDGFGQLATNTVGQFMQLPSDTQWAYQDLDVREYEYDALGRRVLERYQGKNGNERYSIYLFNDVDGRVLEEKRRLLSSATVSVREQYVWSDAGQEFMVLRDRNADESTSTAFYGQPASGLEERLFVEQGPDGSVWEIWPQGEDSDQSEFFVYSPEGDFWVISGRGDDSFDEPAIRSSAYDWRYLWRAGRAESYAYDDGSGTIQRYEGTMWNWQTRQEHDLERGTPLGEDIYAYHTTNGEHLEWTWQQTQAAAAGTGGWWSSPTTLPDGQRYDPGMQFYTPPSWEAPVVTGLAVVGTILTGGMFGAGYAGMAAAAAGTLGGGLAGGAIAEAAGGDFWEGANYGSMIGGFSGRAAMGVGTATLRMAGAGLRSLSPASRFIGVAGVMLSAPSVADAGWVSELGKGISNKLGQRVSTLLAEEVTAAELLLAKGKTGGTVWGHIYQRWLTEGRDVHKLRFAYGKAVQDIAWNQMRPRLSNSLLRRIAYERGSKLGIIGKWNRLRPDLQIEMAGGRWGIIDVTARGSLGKAMSKYAHRRSPFIREVIYDLPEHLR